MKTINGQPGSYPLGEDDTEEPLRDIKLGRVGEYRKTATVRMACLMEDVEIETPEGVMSAKTGDYLAQHQDGHAWPIKRETFESTYEQVGP
jgi:hypothetical protein